jgi:drug/metabolite transporter (DMT)-like permease
MVKSTEMISLVLVGALWGCTNPLLRRGSLEEHPSTTNDTDSSLFSTLKVTLSKFRKVRVWLPYALNQCGSLLFYYLLANADLSMAVPVCNALSLVFSCITSYALGEHVDQPIRAICGSALVMIGVAICMSSQQESSTTQEKESMEGEL